MLNGTLGLGTAGAAGVGGSTNPRLHKAAVEFESVLLGQWLEGAERSFATVPGSEQDEDAGGEQMRSFAMQHLALGLAQQDTLGLARVVERGLAKAADAGAAVPTMDGVAVPKVDGVAVPKVDGMAAQGAWRAKAAGEL